MSSTKAANMVSSSPSVTEESNFSSRLARRAATTMVDRTCVVFWAVLVFIFLCVSAAIAQGSINLSEDDLYTWLPAEGKAAEQKDAVELAQKSVDLGENATAISPRSSPIVDYVFTFLYDFSEPESVFRADNIQQICETEAVVFNQTRYTSFCVLGSDGECEPQTSSLSFRFYGESPSCELLSQAEVDLIADEIIAQGQTDEGALEFGQFLGNDIEIDRDPRFTQRTKSVFNFGGPLEGFRDENDRETEQATIFRDDFLADVESDLFDRFGLSGSFFRSAYREDARIGSLETRWWSVHINWFEFDRLTISDMGWAILSVMFVVLWMRVHTGSCFIAGIGMFQIVMSLPVAAFWYGTVFSIPYFQILHILIIFLVLGVGADDIFVYTDAWRQSEAETEHIQDSKERLTKRVELSYSRTMRAVLNTSITTAAAFLSQTGSSLMPIASLGIFAALAIVLNFIFAITLTPVTVLISERYFGSCCGKKNESKKEAKEDKSAAKISKYYTEPMLRTTTFSPLDIKIKPLPFAIFVLLCAYAGQALYHAFQLTPPDAQEEWFPSDHMFTGFLDDLAEDFVSQTDEQYVDGLMVFGIEGIDRAGYNFWTPGVNLGSVQFNEDFDVYPLENQEALFAACETIAEFECAEGVQGCDVATAIFPQTLSCHIDDFSDWLNATRGITLPSNEISREDFLAELSEFRLTTPSRTTSIGFIDGELKFWAFEFLWTLKLESGYSELGGFIDEANRLAALISDQVPATLNPVIPYGGRDFVWYDSQTALIQNLFEGIIICTPVIFLILAVTTKNVQIALMAVLSVLLVVASVLGLCEWLGWSLGIAEAIAGVIVIGFSVDNVLHLGHMYIEGGHSEGLVSREDRFRFGISRMGGTVLANTITTFGSGFFMFFTQLVFFYKMAVLMCSTIGFSFVFSFGFFMSHCALFGPQGNFATVPLPSQCKKKSGQQTDPSLEVGEL